MVNQRDQREFDKFQDVAGATTVRVYQVSGASLNTMSAKRDQREMDKFQDVLGNPAIRVRVTNTIVEITHTDSPYLASNSTIIICDTTGGDITVNLPILANSLGQTYSIKCKGTGTVTITPNGSDTICGDTSFDLYEDETLVLYASSVEWR